MIKNSRVWTGLCLTLGFSVAVFGFGCKGTGEAPSTAGSSLNGAVGSAGVVVGTVNQTAGFLVQAVVEDPNVSLRFHEQSSATATCTVMPGTTALASKDIYCLLDIGEYDLYLNKVVLNFNVPSSMCKYTRVRPYSFFPFQPGRVSDAAAGGGVTTEDVEYTLVTNAGACDAMASNSSAPNAAPISNCAPTTCRYDYSASGDPNCCEGSTRTTTIIDGASSTTTGTLGGKVSNCLAGPAVSSQAKDIYGFPTDTVYRTLTSGENETYSIEAAWNKGRFSTMYSANYWNINAALRRVLPGFPTGSIIDTGGGSTDFFLPRTMDQGYEDAGFEVITAGYLDGGLGSNCGAGVGRGPCGSQSRASPFYEFHCLDGFEDYVARIRVLVRPFDDSVDFDAGTWNPTAGIETDFTDPVQDRSIHEDYYNTWPGQAY